MQNLAESWDMDIDEGARPTPLPPFDVDAYARDSESCIRALPERDTSPPPALYPSSMAPIPGPPPLPVIPSSSLQSQMNECARRVDLLTTTLRVGAVSREEASRILRTELDALEVAARGTPMNALRTLALRLRDVIAEMGGISEESPEVEREVLVLDADPMTGALVALAVGAHGHSARMATNLDDLTCLPIGADYSAIFVAMDFPGADLARPFCPLLREIVRSDAIPVVIYGRASQARLAAIAERVQADAALRIDVGVENVLSAIGPLLERLMTAA